LDDVATEGSEAYSLTLTGATSASEVAITVGSASSVTTMILDNDSASWAIAGDSSVDEGNAASYTISLSGELQNSEQALIDLTLLSGTTTSGDFSSAFSDAVSVAIATYSGTGSFSWDGTSLTFTSDGTGPMGDLLIAVGALDDSLTEGLETYSVQLTNQASTTGADIRLGNDTQITIINDLDQSAWSIMGDVTVNEGAAASYTVSLSGELQGGETALIDLTLVNGTTTSGDFVEAFGDAVSDAIAAYSGPGSFIWDGTKLTFTGDGSGPMADLFINLAALDDDLVEGPEDYVVSATTPTSTTGAPITVDPLKASVTTTINDPPLVPELGIAVTQGDPVPAGDDGQEFSVPIIYVIQNAGTTELSNLSLVDDLQSQFGTALLGIENISIDNSGVVSGTPVGVTNDWNGDASSLLNGTGVLGPGDTIIVEVDVLIDPDTGGTAKPHGHQAVVTASDPGNPGIIISDVSDSGTEPLSVNADAPGDTGTAEDVTPLQIADAGVTSRVTGVTMEGLTSKMTVELTLENTGTVDLNDLTLLSDLANQLGVNYDAIVVEPILVSSTASIDPTLNPGFVDDTSENIFDGTSGLLKPGEQIVVQFVVQVKAAPGQAEVVLEHQAFGGGTAVDNHGDAILDASGAPLAPILDASDSGSDPNGNNPGQPGDTGGYDDASLMPIIFFTFDSLNNFSEPFGVIEQPVGQPSGRLLTQEIPTLAPEPLFSGTARPGTKVIGRIFDANGFQIGQAEVFADVGGNWIMQVHNLDYSGYARVEFVEIPGIGSLFSPKSDLFGYRGGMHSDEHYSALGPWTSYEHQYDFVAIYRGSASQSLATMHRGNNDPLGFGTTI